MRAWTFAALVAAAEDAAPPAAAAEGEAPPAPGSLEHAIATYWKTETEWMGLHDLEYAKPVEDKSTLTFKASQIKSYFYNLDRSTERKDHMLSELSKLGIAAERVPAAEPGFAMDQKCEDDGLPCKGRWDRTWASALSFMDAMKRCAEDTGYEYCIVSEDDVHYVDALHTADWWHTQANTVVNMLPSNWTGLHICSFSRTYNPVPVILKPWDSLLPGGPIALLVKKAEAAGYLEIFKQEMIDSYGKKMPAVDAVMQRIYTEKNMPVYHIGLPKLCTEEKGFAPDRMGKFEPKVEL